METPTQDVHAESSPAFEVPRDGKAYAEWRLTGKLPESKPAQSKEASTPSSSESGEKPGEKAAPASEAGKHNQEKGGKPRSNAETRLNELLEDLKRAGLSPGELKTFKREAQHQTTQQQQQSAEAAKTASEQTAKPAGELKPPEKPKQEDFKTYAEYDAARDKYFEDFADYKAAKKLEDFRAEQRQQAAQASVHQKMVEAKGRYGDEGIGVIRETAKAFTADQQIPQAVKALIDQSPVWSDILYAIGSKPDELQGFIALAKSDPIGAIRKAVLIEQLVKDELAKGGGKAAEDETEGAKRDDSGKFVSSKKAPEKKESDAPPPPREVSGRGTPPPDEVERAVKDGDARAYFRAQNARDLARRRG